MLFIYHLYIYRSTVVRQWRRTVYAAPTAPRQAQTQLHSHHSRGHWWSIRHWYSWQCPIQGWKDEHTAVFLLTAT